MTASKRIESLAGMKLCNILLPIPWVTRLQELVKRGFYPNRTEAIRNAIRDLIHEHTSRPETNHNGYAVLFYENAIEKIRYAENLKHAIRLAREMSHPYMIIVHGDRIVAEFSNGRILWWNGDE